MDKKIKFINALEPKGIIISTINPIIKNNEEEPDKDPFRGGTHQARVYKVRDNDKAVIRSTSI
jgi:hypothetical protein